MTTVNLLCTYYLHGLDGSQEDFQRIKAKVQETFNTVFNKSKENSNVFNLNYGHCSEKNAHKKSREEFQVLVETSFKELNMFLEETVLDKFKTDNEKEINFENVQQYNLYFSIVGHSLGGLISRGVIKAIFSKFEKDNIQYENYFEYLKQKYTFLNNIKPCSFIALSSPHLGTVTGNELGDISARIMKFCSSFFCKHLSGKIGKTFIYKDGKDNEKPVLIKLCEKEYTNTYAKFPNRTLVACIRHDIPVKFSSAMASLDMPLYEYKKNHLLIDNDTSDTKILSYSGYEGETLNYYQKEIFNEKVSKDMFYVNTLNLQPPNIDQQIKDGLEKLKNKKIKNLTTENYEEMNDVFIPDTMNQTIASVAALKLFNQISYRRIALDFNLPKFSRMGTHPTYMGFIVFKSNPTVEAMVEKTVKLFSNIILADYIRTSEQDSLYSLNDIQ